MIPNQSNINIIYSSDPHEGLNQKGYTQDKIMPFSVVIP